MAPWKKILLKALGVGAGIGIGLGACVVLFAWYSSRPKPEKAWDANAITASFMHVDTNGENHHLRFHYTLENHTDSDYKTPTSILQVTAVVGEQGNLSGAGQVRFGDENIFLPAKQRVLVQLEMPSYSYPGADALLRETAAERQSYRDAVKKYVRDELPRLNGFAAFDEIYRYRINFPNDWRQEEQAHGKNK
jgi:hypothetical protein